MFSEFQANCCWSTPVILRNWYSRWEKRWEERFWRRGGEGGTKVTCGSNSVSWDRKRGGVTLPIIFHVCGPPPGYLHTISSLQRRGATRRGRELEERERVTRTTVSPGRCVTHSEMTRWCLKQRRWSPTIWDTNTHMNECSLLIC